MSGVRIPGVELTLGGAAYVVPPLNAAAVKQYREQVASFFTGAVPDIEIVCKLLHAALQRNYPDTKLDDVEAWVDYGNMLTIMDTVMNTSGLATQVGELSRRIQAAMSPPASRT
jgi:hypothetical protein